MPNYDTSQLDTVQHPALGELKFPKAMPFAERNNIIDGMLTKANIGLDSAVGLSNPFPRSGDFNFDKTLGSTLAPVLRNRPSMPTQPGQRAANIYKQQTGGDISPMPNPAAPPELRGITPGAFDSADPEGKNTAAQLAQNATSLADPMEAAAQIPQLAGTQAYLREKWLPKGASQLGSDDPELLNVAPQLRAGQYKQAATSALSGGFQAATPLMLGAGVLSPAPVLRGLAGGTLASEFAGGLTSRFGGKPEDVNLAKALGGLVGGGVEGWRGFYDKAKIHTINSMADSLMAADNNLGEVDALKMSEEKWDKFHDTGDPKYIDYPGVKKEGLTWMLGKLGANAFRAAQTVNPLAVHDEPAPDLDKLHENLSTLGVTNATQTPQAEGTPSESSEQAAPQGAEEVNLGQGFSPVSTDSGTTLHGSLFGADLVYKKLAEDIGPTVKDWGGNLGTALDELRKGLTPRAFAKKGTLDTLMASTGQRELRRFSLDQMLHGVETSVGKLPQDEQVAFIDRFKAGQRPTQPTQELAQLDDFFRKTDEDTYMRVVEAQVRNMDVADQKLWNQMAPDLKASAVHNLDAVANDPTAPAFLKHLADSITDYKENHFRVLWKTIPGAEPFMLDKFGKRVLDANGQPIRLAGPVGPGPERNPGAFKGRRPWRGDMGFQRQSTLTDMSEGLDRGGVPYSYNPVTLFKMGQMSAERYIIAQNMWNDAAVQGARVFVPVGQHAPDGYNLINDRIGDVRFRSAKEGLPAEAGKWYLRDDYSRLMNNFLSRDYLRESVSGRGLIGMKNRLTAFRLGFSPFHAVVESLSAVAQQAGIGALKIWNEGLREGDIGAAATGLKDILTSPAAPYTLTKAGTSAYKFVTDPAEFIKTLRGQDFVKQYPEIVPMLRDMFNAGAKLTLHEDEALGATNALREFMANADFIHRPITSTVGTAWKGFWAVQEQLYKPLFNHYIPRVKLGSFLKEYSNALTEHEADINSGHMSRGELARQTWDSVEDMFGQVNWDKFFWDRNLKTANQLGLRAAQWFAGNIRITSNAMRGQLGEVLDSAKFIYNKVSPGNPYDVAPSVSAIPKLDPRMAKLSALFTTWVTVNSLVQLGMTGQLPQDAKDLFAPRVGGTDQYGHPRRVSTPAIVWKDAMSIRYQGLKPYLRAKESDLIGGLSDVLNNANFRNDMVYNPEDNWWVKGYDMARHMVGLPIGVENVIQTHEMGDSKGQQALSLLGFKSPPRGFGWSPAENFVYDQAQRDMRAQAPAEQEHLKTFYQTAERMSNKTITDKEIDGLVTSGKLLPKDEDELDRMQNMTMFQRHFERLHVTEALKAYQMATPKEQDELQDILSRKEDNVADDIPLPDQEKVYKQFDELLGKKK